MHVCVCDRACMRYEKEASSPNDARDDTQQQSDETTACEKTRKRRITRARDECAVRVNTANASACACVRVCVRVCSCQEKAPLSANAE